MSVKRKILKAIYKLVMDIIPVIIGILLALYIQNYQENKTNAEFAETVMVSITEEMKENSAELAEKIVDHNSLLDSIDMHMDNPAYSIGLIINQANGVGFVGIKNTAWLSLMNSKMGLVDFKYISVLTNIDETKNYMNPKIEKITDLIFSKIESTRYEDKRLLFIFIEDLLNMEEGLLESHNEFFKYREEEK